MPLSLSPQMPELPRSRARWWAAIALFLAAYVWAFGASLTYGFAHNDFDWVPISYADALRLSLTTQHFRPLWLLTYPLTNDLVGTSALAHHLVSHALHLANCGLALVLLRDWIGARRAAVAVAMWSLLPQVTYPIVWIAQSNDLVMTLFVLLALLAAQRGKQGWSWLLLLAAFLAKLTCIALPLALTSRHALRRTRGDVWAGWVLIALSLAATLWAQQFYVPEAHLAALSPLLRLANAAKNLALGWAFVALPLPYFANGAIIAAWLVFLAALGAVVWRAGRISPAAIRLLILAVLMSLPLALMSEQRITYLMLLFLTGAVMALIDEAALATDRRSRQLAAVALLAFLAYAVPASHLTTRQLASTQFDARKAEDTSQQRSPYPVEVYPAIRAWEEWVLGR